MCITREVLSFTDEGAGVCHSNSLFSLAVGSHVSANNSACVIAIKLDTVSGDNANVCNVSNRSVPYVIA